MSPVGEGDDEVNLGAGKWGTEAEYMGGGSPATYDFGATSAATVATDEQSSATSPSGMKAFEDPVWKRGYRKLTLLENGAQSAVANTMQNYERRVTMVASPKHRCLSYLPRPPLAVPAANLHWRMRTVHLSEGKSGDLKHRMPHRRAWFLRLRLSIQVYLNSLRAPSVQ